MFDLCENPTPMPSRPLICLDITTWTQVKLLYKLKLMSFCQRPMCLSSVFDSLTSFVRDIEILLNRFNGNRSLKRERITHRHTHFRIANKKGKSTFLLINVKYEV